MTSGDTLIASLSLKATFYDQHDRRVYMRAVMLAKRIVDEPEIIATGQTFLERHVRGDPHQSAAYALWRKAIMQSPDSIARSLLEDSPEGAELRNTAPVFVVVTPEAAKALWKQSP